MSRNRKWLAGEAWLGLKWAAFLTLLGGVSTVVIFLALTLIVRIYQQAANGDWAGVGIVVALVLITGLWAYYDKPEDGYEG